MTTPDKPPSTNLAMLRATLAYYEIAEREWSDTPEAREARRHIEALRKRIAELETQA